MERVRGDACLAGVDDEGDILPESGSQRIDIVEMGQHQSGL